MESLYNCALSQIGQDGPFQTKFDILYNVLLPSMWIMAYNNMILALTIPSHICKIPKGPDLISVNDWKLKYIPMEKDAAGVKHFSECLLYESYENTTLTKDCDSYDYDRTWFEATIPSDNNWVCKNEINVANAFAYGRCSEIFGSLTFGWLGDIYGRKPIYILSLLMLIVGRLLSIVASSSFVIFTIGFIIASFPSWSAMQSTAAISLEISSPKQRAKMAMLRLLASSAGMVVMPFLYWWLRSWKYFLLLTTATQLPFLLLSGKMIESPQWLWVNKKFERCIQQLKVIAKGNKTNLDIEMENEILMSDSINSKTEVMGPLALFSGKRLALNTILQLLLWVSVSTNYTIILMSSVDKSNGNPFIGFAWQSLAEIPGYFIATWLSENMGRKFTGLGSCSLTTFIWIVYLYRDISDSMWLNTEWLSTTLLVFSRLSVTMTYYIINLLNMELYPTCLRQSGMSLGNVISGGASAVAPYILYLGHQIDRRYPSVLMVIITTVGGILSTFLLPETLNAKLPETLKDAQNFGRSHNHHHTSRIS